VQRFPGHIACDARSRSEIVLPVIGRNGNLIAVLDIDSEELARFDAQDATSLEYVLRWFSGHGRG
jgi:GAF domain-containing protein